MRRTESQRLYSVECTTCGERFEGGGPWDDFADRARADGWLVVAEGVRCPACVPDPAPDLAALRADLEAVAEEMTNDLRPVTGACLLLDALVHRIRAVAAKM